MGAENCENTTAFASMQSNLQRGPILSTRLMGSYLIKTSLSSGSHAERREREKSLSVEQIGS